MSASSTAQRAPLRGNLAVTSVPDVLSMLEAQACEGRVHFDTEVGHGEVDFANGKIVGAALGELSGRAALFRLLGIVDGSYELSYESVGEREPLVESVAQLVEARTNRFSEWRKLSERAPAPSTIIRLSDAGREELEGDKLPSDQRLVLGLVDGRRSITEVISDSGLDAVEVLTLLINALDRGAILRVEEPVAEAAAKPEPPRPRFGGSLRKATVIGLGIPEATTQESFEAAARGSDAPPQQREGSEFPRATTEVRRIISIGGPSSPPPVNPISSHPPAAEVLPAAPAQSGEVSTGEAEGAGDAAPRSRGRYVGRYEIICPIGRGGMGSVYLCRVTSEGGFRRLFALKLLRRHLLEDSASASKFLEEARLAGQIHHPNVVSVIDAGFHGSQPFLVMDYVEGASFKELLSSHPHARPPSLILPIILDALAGLHASHTLVSDDGAAIGVVHCDVSPENLIVGADGVCRLTDFGVARSAASAFQRETVTRGKPGYLAPEQVLGGPVDRRADVFAMGVVLYNALTGIRLFEAPTAEQTLQQVCVQRIDPPSTVGLRPPPSLDFVCMRALDRDPDRRFASADEMMLELRRIALREGMLGSTVEISSWVRDSVGRELAQRRLVVLDSSRSARPSTAIVPSRSGPTDVVKEVVDATGRRIESEPPESEAEPPRMRTRTEHMERTIVLPPSDGAGKRRALIIASTLAAIVVLVTMLWPNLVSRLFRIETESVVSHADAEPSAAPVGSAGGATPPGDGSPTPVVTPQEPTPKP